MPGHCNINLPSPFGDEALTEAHQKRFVRYFTNSPGPVLEIGCGRGVMLKLLKEAGVEAYGMDASDRAIELCRQKGLNVVQDDSVRHLTTLKAGSLGGIFCAHVIEHMEPKNVIELLSECSRVLKPGSRLILITPNIKDLRTTERFWLDITHVRPYPEKLLVAVLKDKGFKTVKTLEDKEPCKNILEKAAKIFLKMWFMGFMFRGDLVVIAGR